MRTTSFTPALDPIGLANEKYLVVGCGRFPETHPNRPHQIPNPANSEQPLEIQLQDAYTMDVNPEMRPHRVGSFWVADHTEDLPSDRFDGVFFENLPGTLFSNSGWCLVAARTAHRLLKAGKRVVVRTGADMTPTGYLFQSLVKVGFNEVRSAEDQHGFAFFVTGKK